MIDRRTFLRTTALCFSLAGTGWGGGGTAARQPNIVLINADDLGYGDLGCYGATRVKTPNIDRLAAQGRRFTDAHSASAVCTASRFALLTGSYPFRRNLWAPIFLKDPLLIDTHQLTIGSLLQEAGYSTACIGKWHLGFGTTAPTDWNAPLKPGPLEVGFNYYFGVPVVSSHPPFVFVENHGVVGWDKDDPLVYGKKAETKAYPEKMGLNEIGGGRAAHALYDDENVGPTLAGKAVSWLKKQSNKPFFLYLATTNIHHPFTPAPQFVGTSGCGIYGDSIHELDWMVGQVLATLDELGVTDQTMVIFTSDNGGMLNQSGQRAWRAGHHLNGDLLGFKFDAWEGGHRVPFIIRWPGKVPAASVSNELICNVDMLATLAALTGRKLKGDDGPDSFNVLPALTGTPARPIRDHLLVCPRSNRHLAIRKDHWMYIPAQGNGGFGGQRLGEHQLGGPAAQLLTHQVNSDIANGKLKPGAPPAQLYDLGADVSEKQNLYQEKPEVVEQMKALLAKCIASKRTAPLSNN